MLGTKQQPWLRLCDRWLIECERTAEDVFLSKRRAEVETGVDPVAPQTQGGQGSDGFFQFVLDGPEVFVRRRVLSRQRETVSF